MRIRYTTWSLMAVLLLFCAAVSHAVALPRSGDASSTPVAKPKAAAKKPSAAARTTRTSTARTSTAHTSTTRTSAARRRTTAHTTSARAQTVPTADRISEIQAALAKNGAYQGEPTGRWDPATIDAMRQFQNEHNLNPTGKIDALTLQKLGLGSQVAGMGAPLPAAVPQASAADSNEQTARP